MHGPLHAHFRARRLEDASALRPFPSLCLSSSYPGVDLIVRACDASADPEARGRHKRVPSSGKCCRWWPAALMNLLRTSSRHASDSAVRRGRKVAKQEAEVTCSKLELLKGRPRPQTPDPPMDMHPPPALCCACPCTQCLCLRAGLDVPCWTAAPIICSACARVHEQCLVRLARVQGWADPERANPADACLLRAGASLALHGILGIGACRHNCFEDKHSKLAHAHEVSSVHACGAVSGSG